MAYMVVNSRFNPFTYDELIKPFNVYQEAYNEQTAALSKLEMDANTLESALSQTTDPIAYQTYSNYLNKLRGVADEIATNGLHPGSKSEVLKLAGDYSKQIVPIQNAYNRRKELQEEQRKALLNNPTLYFQRNFNTPSGDEASIDKFVADPNYSYGNFFSGTLLEKQVSDAAGNLAKALQNYGVGKRLDAYTKTFLQQHGYSPEQVLDAIYNPDRATSQPVLNSIVESVIQSSGVPSWGDANALNTAYAHARRGLFSAIGQTSVSQFEDFGARHAATTPPTNPFSGAPPIVENDLFGAREQEEAASTIKKYSKYFVELPDGTYKLSKEGEREYKNYETEKARIKKIEDSGDSYNRPGYNPGYDTEFIDFMESINPDKLSPTVAWQEYRRINNHSLYDATRMKEYDYAYDASQQDDIKNVVLSATAGLPLYEVDYNSKSDRFEKTNNILKLDDLAKSDYKILGVKMSHRGTQLMIVGKDGVTKRYEMPGNINQAAEVSRNSALNAANSYRELFAEATTPQEEQEAYQAFLTELWKAYLYQSQIGIVNKTKSQEYNPYSLDVYGK